MPNNLFNTLTRLQLPSGRGGLYYSLGALERAGMGNVSRLPVSLRVILESVLRNADGVRITGEHVRSLAGWKPKEVRTGEIPFVVARIVAPDSSGIPLLADLAAMRDAAARLGKSPALVEPQIRVDFIVDHSVQVDYFRRPDALRLNMELEFKRNGERYGFIKWAAQAFHSLRVAPPGTGIIHQVNMEHWAPGVFEKEGILYPDTLVGADSHTPMINGLGVVGWGVGGIEAEAGMLGEPIYFLTPDVIGVELKGALRPGVTATDLALTMTQRLRSANVVGKFVEFFGEGAAALTATDRATISNMAPEYGATIAYFPVDENTLAYYRETGRSEDLIETVRAYFSAQGLFGVPRPGDCDYSDVIVFRLDEVVPSVAGPRRPQDRIDLNALPDRFNALLGASPEKGGFGRTPAAVSASDGPCKETCAHESKAGPASLKDGSVVLAAITSCTNTSNPGVLLAAGLLAKKAVEKGLSVRPDIKTSFGPGSRVVTEYLGRAGLLEYLERLGFHVVGYGCTTCIGNSGPLDPAVEAEIKSRNLVTAAVLSGNRNFEARIHPAIRANFLMSPPLVVAFAIAGDVTVNLDREPLGTGRDGTPVYLRDVWPAAREIADAMHHAADPELFRRTYSAPDASNGLWETIPLNGGAVFHWDTDSTYLREPPFFEGLSPQAEAPGSIFGARALLVLGDSVTTDHISPGGAIGAETCAGRYLLSQGIAVKEFNTYIARRGNHEVMMRGTFGNVRLRNRMVPGSEGGVTVHWPDGVQTTVYDAAMKYREEGVPLIAFAGAEYGTGSSRDWAAKGTRLLGLRAVVAGSFERIHRSNLVGMGVLPLEFLPGESVESLDITGRERFDVELPGSGVTPGLTVDLVIRREDGTVRRVKLICRIDTTIESEYYRHGGILPYVLRKLAAGK